MSDLYGSPMGGGGLMGLLANPQTAGLLGMAGGLLQASGPTRLPVSNGQALGMGLQGMGQGFTNALQMQRGLMQMRMLQGLMGDQEGAQQAPTNASQPMSSVSGSANVGPMSGLAAGMGGMAPSPAASAASASSAYPAAAPAGPSFGGKSPAQLMREGQIWNMISPGSGNSMISAALSAQAPTDAQKMAGAAYGYGTPEYQAAIQSQVRKAGYQQPLNSRPGTIIRDPYTMQPLAFNPNMPAGTAPMFDASGNVVGANMIPGVTGALQSTAAAKAAGEGSMLPYSGVDAQGNPLPVTTRTAAATQGENVPSPLRNNNPGALMPGGKLAQYPDMQTGLAQLDSNLQSYGKQGINTLAGVISKWAPPNENNTPAYIQDVSQRLGVRPDQPIDLSNPAVRQAISTGIMLHENGPGAVFATPNASQGSQPTARSPGGAIYAAPPLGATSMADKAQSASAKVMGDDYENMQSVRQNAPTVLQAYDHLLDLAKTGGLQGWAANGGITGKLMSTEAATYASPAAAEYDKTRAFLINAGGAAMGEHNTDAARANLDRMIPEFGKPTQAKIDGIIQARNQASMAALRANVMTPLFQAGDSKAYTGLANQFDTSIKPEMMPAIEPILNLPPQQQQAAAQAAYKANPALKPAFAVLLQSGLLK